MPKLPAVLARKLNARQKLFVLAYLGSFNAAQSAIDAGYSEHTARSIGQELLTKPDIASYIAQVQQRMFERAEVSAQKVIMESARLAFMPETHDDGRFDFRRARIKTDNLNLLAKHFGLTRDVIINQTNILAQLSDAIDPADTTRLIESTLSRALGRAVTLDDALAALRAQQALPPPVTIDASSSELVSASAVADAYIDDSRPPLRLVTRSELEDESD